MDTYKVKKGDTLSQIAKTYGVGIGDITGYKSGDPNKIFEGETVTIGKKAPKAETTTAPTFTDDYATNVKKGLEEETDSFNYDDPYGLDKVRKDYDTYKKNRETAYNELKNITTTTFENEYKTKGLAEKKTKLSDIDSSISMAKKQRDDAINAIRTNPNLSASQMTGDIKKLADYQNSVINNLIEERNAIAEEYNAGLTEIDKIVQNNIADKSLDYKYWTDLLGESSGLIDNYTKSYREGLEKEQDQTNFEKQLAQALQIATMKEADGGSSTKLDLVTDKYSGAPMGTFNPRTGQYEEYKDNNSTPATLEDRLYDAYSEDELSQMAKSAGYTQKGGFLGLGKKGNIQAYIDAIKQGLTPTPKL